MMPFSESCVLGHVCPSRKGEVVMKNWKTRMAVGCRSLAVFVVLATGGIGQASAQDTNEAVSDKPGFARFGYGRKTGRTAAQIDRGDNAWMLTSSALVLMMTGPGLAMFYGGLVRKKNVLSVMMQCVFLMGLMTVIWALCGYTLAFGGTRRRGSATATTCS